MAGHKSQQRSEPELPELLANLGVTQNELEDMLEAIDREGYFDIGPMGGEGIPTIDRNYSLHELGLDGLDQHGGA